jgi:hypothetical protein
LEFKVKVLTGFVESQTKLLWNPNRSRQNLTSRLCGRGRSEEEGGLAGRRERARE